jgi:hypothetical protein
VGKDGNPQPIRIEPAARWFTSSRCRSRSKRIVRSRTREVRSEGERVITGDESGPSATPGPDWERVFPDADHAWRMGLRRCDPAEFLAPRDRSGTVLAERARWLAEAPVTYAALTPPAEPALAETVALARALGAGIDPTLDPWAQTLALGRAWECDFVWMTPAGEGAHRLTGGVVCFPSSWALRDKLGGTMAGVHGPVPGLNAALSRQIETFFARMRPGEGWARENANYSRVSDLNQHPARPRPQLDASVTPDEFWIRLEHQFLLKLPASGAVLFAIRVEQVPLRAVLGVPAAVRGLARLLETVPEDAADYKGVLAARAHLVAVLRAISSPGGSAPRTIRTPPTEVP